MNQELIKTALLVARHDLTTLHNLTVTDNTESGVKWVTDTNESLKLLDDALIEFECKHSHPF
ncbi:hypothetical protein [Acinetobacter bereziniae]|uniref:hypothetical protein n=1 Tax=Acinetobacter bereziniae TaxID=106648 RepID=UPI001A499EDC|nr:hypothetical protein [Acinetobacter sp.]